MSSCCRWTPDVRRGGKSVRIPFTIESAAAREYVTAVQLRTSDGDELSREVRIAADEPHQRLDRLKPRSTGNFTLTLEVPKHGDETLTDNNRMTAPISIREEKLRVLVVESYPRWEYRYLRNALSRDPGVDVSCCSSIQGSPRWAEATRTTSSSSLPVWTSYPGTMCLPGRRGYWRWAIDRRAMPADQGLVEYQASGLVFMPGMEGRQFSLLETELGDLYPVVLDGRPARVVGARARPTTSS